MFIIDRYITNDTMLGDLNNISWTKDSTSLLFSFALRGSYAVARWQPSSKYLLKSLLPGTPLHSGLLSSSLLLDPLCSLHSTVFLIRLLKSSTFLHKPTWSSSSQQQATLWYQLLYYLFFCCFDQTPWPKQFPGERYYLAHASTRIRVHNDGEGLVAGSDRSRKPRHHMFKLTEESVRARLQWAWLKISKSAPGDVLPPGSPRLLVLL